MSARSLPFPTVERPFQSGRCEPDYNGDAFVRPPPWSEMPVGGRPFNYIRVLDPTPAADGTETIVLNQQVPDGMNAVIFGVMNYFQGAGFEQGAGDLIWRLRTGPNSATQGRPVLGFSDIRTFLGDFYRSFMQVDGGILVASTDYIIYTVTHALVSPIVPAGTSIFAGIKGYYWPQGGDRSKMADRAWL